MKKLNEKIDCLRYLYKDSSNLLSLLEAFSKFSFNSAWSSKAAIPPNRQRIFELIQTRYYLERKT